MIFWLENSVLCLVVEFWALCPQMSSKTQSDQLRNITAESINNINQDIYNHQSKNHLGSRSDPIVLFIFPVKDNQNSD